MVKDSQSVWNNCLKVIREYVPEQGYKTWFEPIIPHAFKENTLTIQVPSQFFYEYLEENYLVILGKAVSSVLGKDGKLEYSIVVDRGNANAKPYTTNIPSAGKPVVTETRQESAAENHSIFKSGLRNPFEIINADPNGLESHLNPHYTFDNFIEGDYNRLARSAGIAVANKPGINSFNPLLIYGNVGLGKTHLVHAIGNKIKQTIPNKAVLYVSSNEFGKQYVEAVANNKMQDFSAFYFNIDVLLIDDVQFFANKGKMQELFFDIFNHLHIHGKQIILTSDRPPKDLNGVEDRLLTRFRWGLTADLQQPDFETKLAIIHAKIEAEGIHMPEDVIEYIAYSVDSSIRDLEGVLITLVAQSTLNRKEIDLELAKQTINNSIHNIESEVSIDYIQKSVAEYFGITPEEMKDKTRKMEIVVPRQIAMYFGKLFTNLSLKQIGYQFGKRDHSTVIHAISSVEDMIETDRKIKSSVEELQKRIKLRAT
ncbi:MAG: chromosomal replication initiator protein DnaA [Cytophagales bacterium]|nr:chromosomal replication initiator protein DnaA [Cytophagales bacterium]